MYAHFLEQISAHTELHNLALWVYSIRQDARDAWSSQEEHQWTVYLADALNLVFIGDNIASILSMFLTELSDPIQNNPPEYVRLLIMAFCVISVI